VDADWPVIGRIRPILIGPLSAASTTALLWNAKAARMAWPTSRLCLLKLLLPLEKIQSGALVLPARLRGIEPCNQGASQLKLAASSVLPLPLYFATFG